MPRRPIGRGVQMSPWTWSAQDYLGRSLTISVVFNDNSGNLSSASVTRDVGCLYGRIFIGIGVDGSPDSSARILEVPVGVTNVTAQQLGALGFSVVEDILELQITAGP